jgi:hypothetical protein
MKSYPAPPIPAETVEAMTRLIGSGASREEVFAAMRRSGLFMGQSIQLAARLYGMSLRDAKIAVHYSSTWADCRTGAEALHEAAFQAAKELGFEETPAAMREEVAR